MAENCFINGIVYYSGNLSKQILLRKRKIQYINVPMQSVENKYLESFGRASSAKTKPTEPRTIAGITKL